MNIKLLITSIILINFILLLTACDEERVKPALVSINEKNMPDNELWNSSIVFSDSGNVKAILRAANIKVYNNNNETLLSNGIQIDFYDKNKHLSTLTAERGRVDHIRNDLFAYKNVIAKSDSGVTLYTDELIWIESRKKITTDKYVEIISPKETIRGYGFESDPDLRDYVIYKVSGTIESKESIIK